MIFAEIFITNYSQWMGKTFSNNFNFKFSIYNSFSNEKLTLAIIRNFYEKKEMAQTKLAKSKSSLFYVCD